MDFSKILSPVLVKNMSPSCKHVMNVDFQDVCVLVKHKNSIQRFRVSPYSLKCKFLCIALVKTFAIGSSCVKIPSVLLVFIQKSHLSFALRCRILESSLVDQVIRYVQGTRAICLTILPGAYEISVFLLVMKNRLGF